MKPKILYFQLEKGAEGVLEAWLALRGEAGPGLALVIQPCLSAAELGNGILAYRCRLAITTLQTEFAWF